MRTAYFALKGKNAPADAFRAVRSLGFNANNGVQEAEFKIDDLVLRTAAVSGLGNTRALLERIDRGEVRLRLRGGHGLPWRLCGRRRTAHPRWEGAGL